MNGVPSSGSLCDRPLPQLLLDLAAAGTTGTLRLEAGGERVEVQLAAGHPVRCGGGGEAPGVVELLVERGNLAPEAGDRALTTARSKRCAPEQALLGLKLISPRDLVEALRAVLSRRLVALGRHENGKYELDALAPPPEEAVAFRTDPVPIVQEIVETIWRPDRMLNDLGDWAEGPVRLTESAGGVAARLARRDGVAKVLAGLDGTRSLWSLLGSASAAGPIAALWVLSQLGALETATEEPDDAHEREAPAGSAVGGEAEVPNEASPEAPAAPEIEIVLAGGEAAALGQECAAAGAEGAPGAEDDKAAALRDDILEKHRQLAEIDHYTLLGVDRDANAARIKRAYLQAAKRFHPDALARLGLTDLKEEAGEVFAQIAKAHAALSYADSRRDYDAALAGHREVDADQVAQAEILYRKGDMLMRAGNFREATDYVEASCELWPEDPAYQAAFGWCLYKNHPPDEVRAREHLERAIALDETFAQAHRRLAIVLKALGEVDAAARHTQRGKQLDPDAKP